MFFRKISTLFMVLLLTGCATQSTLIEARYVADNWFVAAQDDKTNVFIHTKNMGTIQKTINLDGGYSKIVIVEKNDTLVGISNEMYGSPHFVKLLAVYNDIENINLLIEGEEIVVPFDNGKQSIINPIQWQVRFVNASDTPICVNVQFLSTDYIVNIEDVWYVLDANSTSYVGDIVQNHWVLEDSVVVLEDAKWKVGSITTAKALNEYECDIG